MNDVEKIIELYEKAKKADEYKSQLDEIYKICRARQDDIMSFHSIGHIDKLVRETLCENDAVFKLSTEILGKINI